MKALEIVEVENGYIVFEGCSNDPSVPPGAYRTMRRRWVASDSIDLAGLIKKIADETEATGSVDKETTQRA